MHISSTSRSSSSSSSLSSSSSSFSSRGRSNRECVRLKRAEGSWAGQAAGRPSKKRLGDCTHLGLGRRGGGLRAAASGCRFAPDWGLWCLGLWLLRWRWWQRCVAAGGWALFDTCLPLRWASSPIGQLWTAGAVHWMAGAFQQLQVATAQSSRLLFTCRLLVARPGAPRGARRPSSLPAFMCDALQHARGDQAFELVRLQLPPGRLAIIAWPLRQQVVAKQRQVQLRHRHRIHMVGRGLASAALARGCHASRSR